MTLTEFQFNDGGRSLYYKGKGGDCVTRAVAIASGLDYKEAYDALAKGNASQRKSKHDKGTRRKTALRGIDTKRKWFKDYMASLGFVWVPTMQIGEGCAVHLCQEELPSGRLVVAVSRHYTAMIDGVIHDTYNPQRTWSRPDKGEELSSNEFRTESNNMIHAETRCVYGFWILNE
jgi:hypothetical protein